MAVCSVEQIPNPDATTTATDFDSHKDAVAYAHQQRTPWLNEAGIVDEYPDFFGPSRSLRAGVKLDEFELQSLAKADALLVDTPAVLSGDTFLYRGVSDSRFLPDEVGGVFADDGFAFTSLSKQIADNYAIGTRGTVIRIIAPDGTKGAWGLSPSHAEFVLGRGSRYQVVDIGTTISSVTEEPVPMITLRLI